MVVGSIVTATLSRVFADDLKAWRPRLTKKIVALAVHKLSHAQRERYAEEWMSYVDEIPGEIGKVLAALGLLWAAAQIGLASRKDRQKGVAAIKSGGEGRRASFAYLFHKVLTFFNRFQIQIFIFNSAIQLGSIVGVLLRSHWSLQTVRLRGSLPILEIDVAAYTILLACELWLTWRKRRAGAVLYGAVLERISGAARSMIELNAKLTKIGPPPEPPEASGHTGPRA
jgi:hypothetical protein